MTPAVVRRLIETLDPDGQVRKGFAAGSSPPPSSVPLDRPDEERVRRASAYLAKMPGAVQGQGGSGATYAAATALVHGFCLDAGQAYALLVNEYNPRCEPPWSEAELRHKIDDAATKTHREPRGWLLAADNRDRDPPLPAMDDAAAAWLAGKSAVPSAGVGCPAPAPPPPLAPAGQSVRKPVNRHPGDVDNPHRLAHGFLGEPGNEHLRSYREDWLRWHDGAYQAVTNADVKAEASNFIDSEFRAAFLVESQAYAAGGSEGKPPRMRDVSVNLVNNCLNALRGLRNVPAGVESPAWIDGATGPPPGSLIAVRNGLYSLDTGDLLPHSPAFLTFSAAPFDHDPAALAPATWLQFLGELWPDDPESVACLQEWFGYLLTTDTSLQKMLMMIGPRRSGKGTIARVLKALVGERNFAGPTLNGLTTTFGLSGLIGRSVALVDDARLSGRADSTIVTERLLAITGEGTIDVDRKFREGIPVKLSTRFVIVTNELPRIVDASGALAGRVILLQFTRSFFNREDPTLTRRIIESDLPGIFRWAVEGLHRLRKRGAFLQPGSGRDAIDEMEELGSPVGAFLRERCVIDPDASIDTKELFGAWKAWCEETGRDKPGTIQVFARDMKAVNSAMATKVVRTSRGLSRNFLSVRLLRIDEEPLENDGCCAITPNVARNFLFNTSREGETVIGKAVESYKGEIAQHRATAPQFQKGDDL